MAKENKVMLPPSIRVFLSSTFSDMEYERTYFNQTIAPSLARMCKERGVSFFSVDLRWGITQEEAENGEVLSICLHEIDKCRPYFIGIIGNKYGTVVEEISKDMEESIPWIAGKAGCSITELEMLYGVLDKELNTDTPNCSFYFRSDELTNQWYSEQQPETHFEKLDALKQTIQQNASLSSFQYNSLEEFGNQVLEDFSKWLDINFPKGNDIRQIRNRWFSAELRRNYVAVSGAEEFLNTYWSNSHQALMVYGEGKRGKTSLLNNYEPLNGEKVLINCGADKRYLYWPEIAHELIEKLNDIDSNIGYPDVKFSASMLFSMIHKFKNKDASGDSDNGEHFYVNSEELENFRKAFCRWLRGIRTSKKIYIVINDLNLLSDLSSHYLSWLPSDLPDNLYLMCSTNEEDMVETVRNLDWNVFEVPLFSADNAAEFFDAYLKSYGKGLSKKQKGSIINNKLAFYPGYLKLISDFLILHGRFSTLNELTDAISSVDNTNSLYSYILSYMTSSLTINEQKILETTFALLYAARDNILELECLQLVRKATEVNALEWANVRLVLEPLGVITGDYWVMQNKELSAYIYSILDNKSIENAHSILSQYYLTLFRTENGHNDSTMVTIRQRIEIAADAVYHAKESRDYEYLKELLLDKEIISTLADLNVSDLRVAWIDVLFNSDTDVAGELIDLLRDLHKWSSTLNKNNRKTEVVIIKLINDLVLTEAQEKLPDIFGEKVVLSDLDTVGIEDLSQTFFEWLKSYNGAIDETAVSAKLAEGGLNPYEKCYLLEKKIAYVLLRNDVQNCMKLSNEYYNVALEIASMNILCLAIVLRLECLYRLRKYDEVLKLYPTAKRIAKTSGNLAQILAADNILALNYWRTGEYEKASQLFKQLADKWKCLKNLREVCNVKLNYSNVLVEQEKYGEAYSLLSSTLEEALKGDTDKLYKIAISLEGSLGAVCVKMGREQEAQEHLIRAIKKGKEKNLDTVVINALNHLAKLYEDNQKLEKAADAYEQIMQLHFRRKELENLAVALHSCMKALSKLSYKKRSAELFDKWVKEFDKIPNGRAILDLKFRRKDVDTRNIHQLQEEINVARSANDVLMQATLTEALGNAFCEENLCDDGILRLLEAYDLYRGLCDEEKAVRCINNAISRLVLSVLSNLDALVDAVLSRTKSTSDAEVITLWKQVHYSKDMLNPEEVVRLLIKVSEYSQSCPYCSAYCIAGSIAEIINFCSEDEINLIFDNFEKSEYFDLLCLKVNDYFEAEDTSQKRLMELKEDYTSDKAMANLEYIEKCIAILNRINSINSAALAGNIALMYRRRRDKEKTLKYHNISATAYHNANYTHDYLIERTNLATAYMEFNRTQEAIEVLRETLAEALNAQDKVVSGSVAGNLAQLLMREDDPHKYTEEIKKCYAIEEQVFRELELHRDLIISLVNQSVYTVGHNTQEIHLATQKLREAKELTKKYGFKEFESSIKQLEGLINAGSKVVTRHNINSSELSEAMKSLFENSEYFKIGRLEDKEEGCLVLCLPKENLPTVTVNIQAILVKADDEWIIKTTFLLRPDMSHEKTDVLILQYANHFTSKGYYPLVYREKEKLLLSEKVFHEKSLDELKSKVNQQTQYWWLDAINVTMFTISEAPVDEIVDIKLKTMDDSQPDD